MIVGQNRTVDFQISIVHMLKLWWENFAWSRCAIRRLGAVRHFWFWATFLRVARNIMLILCNPALLDLQVSAFFLWQYRNSMVMSVERRYLILVQCGWRDWILYTHAKGWFCKHQSRAISLARNGTNFGQSGVLRGAVYWDEIILIIQLTVNVKVEIVRSRTRLYF